jgi:hypothetical protein
MMCSDDVGGMKHDLTGGAERWGELELCDFATLRLCYFATLRVPAGCGAFAVGLELGSVWRVSEERRDLEHSARRKPAGVDRR